MGDLAPVQHKLALLVPRLGTDHDGEIVATVLAIRRLLGAHGLDLHDLAAALGTTEQDEPEHVRWYAELRGFAEHLGYKPGWAHFAFVDRFPGAQTPWPEPAPRMPGDEVCRWAADRRRPVGPGAKMSAAARQRRRRARKNRGEAVYTVEARVEDLEAFLEGTGWLSAIEPEKRDVEAALAAFIKHVTRDIITFE